VENGEQRGVKKEREGGSGEGSERVKEMARRAKVQNKMVFVCLFVCVCVCVCVRARVCV
jgi:t-SNARE complex subunit (syntaxin)